MGLLDFFSSTSDMPQSQNSIDLGREAFKYFHNHSSRYAEYGNITMDEALIQVARFGHPFKSYDNDQKLEAIFLDGLGGAVYDVEQQGLMDTSGLKNAMESLADKSMGRLPTASSFFKAISDSASNPDFITTSLAIAPAVAGDIIDGTVAIGNSVIETGKWVTTLLPVVVVGALLFIVVARSRQLAGK